MKKTLSILLAFILIFSAVPMSSIADFIKDIDFSFLSVKSNAASESDLTFTLKSDGNSYSLTDCVGYVNGELIIPAKHNGKPVTSIGGRAFYDCSSLTKITIPNSVTSIGDDAFYGCSSLTSIMIPDSVTSIGNYAFCDCSNLTSVTIPESMISIGGWVFFGCSSLTCINVDSGNTKFCSVDGILFDFEKTILYCYPAGKSNKSYIIPDGVTSIGICAFENCDDLTHITIPDSVLSIYYGAFGSCSSLTNIIIPDNVTRIDSHAFNGCSSLTSITIPDSVTSIEGSAFENCSSLTSITIPDSVTSIKGSAFENCSSLTSITISDSVTSIGRCAFYNCSSLTSITIPNSVTSIGYSVFSGCSSLKSINVDSDNTKYCSVEGILFNFEKTNLICYPAGKSDTTYVIPTSVTNIDDVAFLGCSSLISIAIPDSVTSIGSYAFGDCSSIMSLILPDSITSIGKGVFYGCNNLTIKCIKNSVAHKYAVDNSIKYELIDDWSNKNSSVKLGSASIQNGSVKVTWSKLSGAESYIVYRKAGSAKTWSKIGTSKTTSYTDKSVKSGTTYKYTVCGVNGKTNSKKNETGISVLYLSTPSTKAVNKNGYISVSWGKVTGATGYIVYRKAGSAKSWSKLATISKNSTVTYTDKSVKSGTDYTYCVKAYKGKTTSAGISVALKYLSAPKLSKVTSAKAGVTVQWGKVTGASGYVVYRKTGSGKFTKLATVKGNTKVSYLDKSAKKGTTYTYTVAAYNGKTYSAYNTTGLKIKDKY